MTTASAPVHERLATLADPTRGRILLVLEQHELTVGELCSVMGLPQSTVSRHLRVLADESWVVTRQEGTSRFYSRNPGIEETAARLWALVADDLRSGSFWPEDQTRLAGVLAQRRRTSREFFEGAGQEWDGLREELFGGLGASPLLALVGDSLVVGDLGCGTGHVSAALAPWVGGIIAVDASASMLEQAKQRLAGTPGVEFRAGELEALPIEDESLDAAILSLVLHYAAEPARVLAEATRTLRPGGRVLVVDILPHERVEYRQRMGHVWLGFAPTQMREWLAETGFERIRVRELPLDPVARGPRLFVATAVRRQS